MTLCDIVKPSKLIFQLGHNVTQYNLLLWQLRGATGGGKSDFVPQDKSDFVLQDKSDFFLTCIDLLPTLAIKCVEFTFFGA